MSEGISEDLREYGIKLEMEDLRRRIRRSLGFINSHVSEMERSIGDTGEVDAYQAERLSVDALELLRLAAMLRGAKEIISIAVFEK